MKAPFKVLISVLALGAMASTPLLRAQDDKAPPAEGRKGGGRGQMMSMEERVAQLDKAVGGLTDDQKTKIKAIYAKAQEQTQAARGGGDGEAMRAKMQEIQKSSREQVRAVLTAEQQAKFDAMPAPGRGQGGPGGGGGGKKKKEN